MSDEQPRQVIPRTESHQNLLNNLTTSRPLPPRNRRGGARCASSRSVQDDENEATSGLGLEAHGKALSSVSINRTVSNSSHRSSPGPVMVTTELPCQEIEKALEGLTRDDLVVALGRAKVQMDELDNKLESQLLDYETLQASSQSLLSQLNLSEAELHSLTLVIKQREDRIDEIMADQERMESQVYSKMQVIDRLRKQLGESEKSRNDAEKRYTDQTTTMDKERQYYADTEALLKSQKATQAAAYEKLLSSHHELLKENERMTNTLAQIKATEGGAQTAALAEARLDEEGLGQDISADASLRDEEEYDDVQGAARRTSRRSRRSVSRSFAQEISTETLKEELATLQKSHSSLTEAMGTLQSELKDLKTENAALRNQNETFIDILQEKTFSGALLNESAMLSGGLAQRKAEAFQSDEEDSEFADSTGNTTFEEDDVPDTPKAPVRPRRKRQSASILELPPSDLASELEQSDVDAEEKKRRQERRTGLVSDNIEELQTEVRELREANQALTLYIAKIIDRIIAREGYENILAVDGKGTMGKRKPSRHGLKASTFEPNTTATEQAAPAPRPKSKRASSIDWRNLPFIGGASASTPPSNLKPLTLQSSSAPARKVRNSEEMEDETDVAERERIRKELLEKGIQPPSHQLVQSPSSPSKGASSGGFAAFFTRVVSGGSTSPDTLSDTTPGRYSNLDSLATKLGTEAPRTSTPILTDRNEERTRALQLGTGLTELKGQGVGARARQMRLERSEASSSAASRSISSESSGVESSFFDNSVAGDESYSLPPPRTERAGTNTSPLLGYGNQLPPLPSMTTGDEDPVSYNKPVGWKKALRRISILSGGTAPDSPTITEGGSVQNPTDEDPKP